MNSLHIVLVSIVGYFLGSISFSVLVSRGRGVDIFKEGSGNPGATNVKRVLGSKLGNLVFVLDGLKGFIATAWPFLIFSKDISLQLGIIALVASIVGHSFSIFLRFRGGKGVATSMGGLLAIMPLALIFGVLIWLVLFYTTRVVALASIAFGLSLPLSTCFLYAMNDPRVTLGMLLGLLIVFRHRSNITRLLQGKENRF